MFTTIRLRIQTLTGCCSNRCDDRKPEESFNNERRSCDVKRVWIALAVERDTIAVGFKTKLVRLKRNVPWPWYQQRWINSRCSSHHHPVRCAMLSVSTLSNISICSPPKSGRGSAQVKHMTPPTLPYAVNVSFVAAQGSGMECTFTRGLWVSRNRN